MKVDVLNHFIRTVLYVSDRFCCRQKVASCILCCSRFVCKRNEITNFRIHIDIMTVLEWDFTPLLYLSQPALGRSSIRAESHALDGRYVTNERAIHLALCMFECMFRNNWWKCLVWINLSFQINQIHVFFMTLNFFQQKNEFNQV